MFEAPHAMVMDGVALTRTETATVALLPNVVDKECSSLVPPLFFVIITIGLMEHKPIQTNLPVVLPFPIEDQRQGFKAIRPGSFMVLSIGYELPMKKLLDPDVDDVMSSIPNKSFWP